MRNRQLAEVVLGRGDYAAGGACTEPFLELDGARRRRPMVLGEVDLGDVDPLVESMFSGRASDPEEWAVMWKELGADGVCVRTRDVPGAADTVRRIEERIGLPIMVDGSDDVLRDCAGIGGTKLILVGRKEPGHAVAVPVDSDDMMEDADDRMLLVRGRFPEPEAFDTARDIRNRALDGEAGFDSPIVFDVTPVWDGGFEDERRASMIEGEASLVAMLSGADVIVVRGPGAADMARVYGEELADL